MVLWMSHLAVTYNSRAACILSMVPFEMYFVFITYNFTSIFVLMSKLITSTHKQHLAHCEWTWSQQINLTLLVNAFSMIWCWKLRFFIVLSILKIFVCLQGIGISFWGIKSDFVKGIEIHYWQRLNVPFVLVSFGLKVSFTGE
jgi:hypothetical protein